MINTAKIFAHPDEKNRLKIFVCISVLITNLWYLLFVSDIDYQQFFGFCANYRDRFVFVF